MKRYVSFKSRQGVGLSSRPIHTICTSLAVSLSASVVSFSRRLTCVDTPQCQSDATRVLCTDEPQSVAYLVVLHQKPCVSKDGSQTPTNAAWPDTHMVHLSVSTYPGTCMVSDTRSAHDSPSLPIGGWRQSRWACKYTASPSPRDSVLRTRFKAHKVNNKCRSLYPSILTYSGPWLPTQQQHALPAT